MQVGQTAQSPDAELALGTRNPGTYVNVPLLHGAQGPQGGVQWAVACDFLDHTQVVTILFAVSTGKT